MTVDPIIFTSFFAQIIVNIFIITVWNSPELMKYHGVYQAEQKIHEGFIPRFGGLAMLIPFCVLLYFDRIPNPYNTIFIYALGCLIPLIAVTFLEDVYNNILPLARLFFIFLSSLLILAAGIFPLPLIDLPIIADFFISYPWVLIIFLTLSMAAMVNAFNLIDGANGLLIMTFISILGCLKLMAGLVNDAAFITLLNGIITICFIQLIFNFPKAKMFAGDLGAYSFGFIVGLLVIIFFGKHSDFLTWQAIVILFYPACEMVFTVFRRVKNNRSPMQADRSHLHQLIFVLLNNRIKKNILSNALTTIILSPIWGFAFLWLAIHGVQLDLSLTTYGLILNLALYLIFYFCASRLSSNE